MADTLGAVYLRDAIDLFREYKKLGDEAMAQISDEDFVRLLDPEANSVALVVKHMAGNMRSRWTDFLTTDGEKPDRHRDTEFEHDEVDTRDALMRRWEEGWALVFAAVEPLGGDDLLRVVQIRGEDHTVLEAINRQLTHYAYHVGQIVFLAKHFTSSEWKTLSVPRGGTVTFNAEMFSKRDSQG